MAGQRRARKRYRDEGIVASLMDLPFWLVLASLVVSWLLLLVVYGLLGQFYPVFKVQSGLVGGGLAYLFVAVAFWIALGERSLRRRRLQTASSLYRLRGLSAYEFQEAVTELFRLQGYFVTENKRQDDEDGGVDLELDKGGETLLVQVKHNWNDVKVQPVRELWGIVASEGAAGAVFVTSGGYTGRAREFAADKRYRLIDGEEFLAMRQEILPTVDRSAIDHDPVVSNGFARHLASQPPRACPQQGCGKPMVAVTILNGAFKANQFWSCPDWKTSGHPPQPFIAYLGDLADEATVGPRSRWEILRSGRFGRRTQAGRRDHVDRPATGTATASSPPSDTRSSAPPS